MQYSSTFPTHEKKCFHYSLNFANDEKCQKIFSKKLLTINKMV